MIFHRKNRGHLPNNIDRELRQSAFVLTLCTLMTIIDVWIAVSLFSRCAEASKRGSQPDGEQTIHAHP